jgi:GMP synthase-like glutamine amidotransferase
MILVIKHIDIEGPGTLGDFLKAQGEDFCTVELGAGEKLPADSKSFKAVVVLGGPMNVDEEDKYPFLKPENDFIQKVIKAEIPYLGICLGSQLLAKAAGARVVKSPVKEIGWYQVQLTQVGKKDPLFEGFKPQDPVYQWHGDMFQIPANGQLLATARGCPHQALKVGRKAYGWQFHVEVTDKSIKEWCDEYCETDLPPPAGEAGGRHDHAASMMEDYWKYKKVFDRQANQLYDNFLNICHSSGRRPKNLKVS